MAANVAQPDSADNRWPRECAVVGAVVALVLVGYVWRMGDLPIQGEEPTRVQVAFEMVQSGDWITPRQQGEPFLTRPPLQNWLIAATCVTLGTWEPWAVRIPSVTAMLLTTLLVYGYSRNSLSQLGAFAAAAVFATMGHMLQLGWQAETDALLILCISSSLLVWHWGSMRGWPDALTFSLGYALMALGSLTKGMQAPTYFVAVIVVYLVITRQWRRLFSPTHALGILIGAAIHLAWILPQAEAVGWQGARGAWMADGAMQHNGDFRRWNMGQTVFHLFTYPLEILGAMLPWSLLLLLFLRKDFRSSIGAARPMVVFLTTCLAVTLPTCWIPAGTLARYFASLYPCLAVLIGLAIERLAHAEATPVMRFAWRSYVGVLGSAMLLGAGVVVILSGLGVLGIPNDTWADTPLTALAFAFILAALGVLALRARSGEGPRSAFQATAAVAVFMVIAFAGVYINRQERRCEYPAANVERIKQQLPPDQPLVCLGDVWTFDPVFAYYYKPAIIRPQPWPAAGSNPDWTYFCFRCAGDQRPILPFAWQEIGAVSVDRHRHEIPEQVFVVGRRLSTPTAAGANATPARLVNR